jgi:hypothetical protein
MNHSSGAWCLLPSDLGGSKTVVEIRLGPFARAALGLAFLGDRDGSVQPRMRMERNMN